MVTGGALALSAGAAHADAGAQGAAVGSPGVGSGNTVQLPVHVPVNVCGNTVNVVGLLNPAAGNRCANTSPSDGYGSDAHGGGQSHKDLPGTPRSGGHPGGGAHNDTPGGSSNGGGATAEGVAKGSPGVLSGNGIQLPIDLPVNVSGNSVNVVGIGNPAIGNTSVNGPGEHETPGEEPKPPVPPKEQPKPLPEPVEDDVEAPAPAPAPGPQDDSAELASTGSDLIGYAAPAGAALLLAGALVYRRASRAGAQA